AGVVTTAWAHVTGIPPIAPLEAVKMARKKMFVTHAKAQQELGYSPGPVNAALERAITWFKTNAYC
ncbi:MAG: dihydroflavonol 4-reductase, partial [Acidobacteriaceae bacterium]|nr:dihydroflavonol 4-reductase [Acidobacteriaceae bacterium]